MTTLLLLIGLSILVGGVHGFIQHKKENGVIQYYSETDDDNVVELMTIVLIENKIVWSFNDIIDLAQLSKLGTLRKHEAKKIYDEKK